MPDHLESIFDTETCSEERAIQLLTEAGFSKPQVARKRLLGLREREGDERASHSSCLQMLLLSLANTATPDNSLLNFERYVQSVKDQDELFQFLADNPRAVEILVKLFVGSQFLSEILLQNPDYLEVLTRHKKLSDFKSQYQFFYEAKARCQEREKFAEKMVQLHHFYHWEILRIGACDAFGLMDLKTITLQLSLLADSIVQTTLALLSEDLEIDLEDFAVLAFGKLGGEELNYSSDIDLVFISKENSARFWTLGQKLIRALTETTSHGFFYRVDMRLRPWGQSGSLVCTVGSYLDYLRKHGMLWEKQALIKARGIAGNLSVARNFLTEVQPIIYNSNSEDVRLSIQKMKGKIETNLKKKNRNWGEVKAGVGSIRDVEFVTQYLQLIHGAVYPQVRSINTLDALIRLTDHSLIQANEYRQLSNGYVFLRIVEHSLQLMHYKQVHALPETQRELAYLARRLDFPDAEHFVSTYEKHRKEIRKVYNRYIHKDSEENSLTAVLSTQTFSERLTFFEPTYAERYTPNDLENHNRLYEQLSNENPIVLESEVIANATDEHIKGITQKHTKSSDAELPNEMTVQHYRLTIVGHDRIGLMPLICGLLFAYGYDIISGDIFTIDSDGQMGRQLPSHGADSRRFICVLTVKPSLPVVPDEVWKRYREDLLKLMKTLKEGKRSEAFGALARRVATAVLPIRKIQPTLYPVEIEIENSVSETKTVLKIRATDSPGFLYELGNGLALQGVLVHRLVVQNVGNHVADTLYVTDEKGQKIDQPEKIRELRAAIVLIKHFSHLLPQSPNPENALLHFRDFLEHLFKQENWLDDLASLEQSEVLETLARLLGFSDFLWEDFLRLQHSNLFPVVANVDALANRKPKEMMQKELAIETANCENINQKIEAVNAFKDREMLRTDLRHILEYEKTFGHFSHELTDASEVVVQACYELQNEKLLERYGEACPMAIAALGKCGGKELGFASDIELMFIYEDNRPTSGTKSITSSEYHQKLVEGFQKSIHAKREGIFQLDLRLRPYGKAGALAVSLDAFQKYFHATGPAWPYERQALVKLRTIAGNEKLGRKLTELRDKLIYTGEPFDVTAMRGMRQKQIQQLVRAGTVNAKLSLGGLVDCEYLTQGLQITFGHRAEELRSTNTREALKGLEKFGLMSGENRVIIRDCYRFLRRLIDALRMVRGDARDLTIPKFDSEEFEFLARRLEHRGNPRQIQKEIEETMATVRSMDHLLDEACLDSQTIARRIPSRDHYM